MHTIIASGSASHGSPQLESTTFRPQCCLPAAVAFGAPVHCDALAQPATAVALAVTAVALAALATTATTAATLAQPAVAAASFFHYVFDRPLQGIWELRMLFQLR